MNWEVMIWGPLRTGLKLLEAILSIVVRSYSSLVYTRILGKSMAASQGVSGGEFNTDDPKEM